MQEFPEDWPLRLKIDFLQRKILLNAICYYKFDRSYLSDFFYDSISHQLADLQREYLEEGGDLMRDTRYGYVYYDFEGSTGYHLFDRLTYTDKQRLLDICKEGNR